MRKFAFVPAGCGSLQRGYPVFRSVIQDVVENWKHVRVNNPNVQKRVKNPRISTETLGHNANTEETSNPTAFGKEIVLQLSSHTPISSLASHSQTSASISRPSPVLVAPLNTSLPELILNADNTLVTGQTQAVSLTLFHRRSESAENKDFSQSKGFCDSYSMDKFSDPELLDLEPRWSISPSIPDFSDGGDGGCGWAEDEHWSPVISIPPIDTGRANSISSPVSPNLRAHPEAIDSPQFPSPSLSSLHGASVEQAEEVFCEEESGALTDDSVADPQAEAGLSSVILPFGLTRRANRAVPLQTQSLMELTAKLLCARQNARATDWSKLWSIHLQDALEGVTSYYASFDDQVQAGLRLVLLTLGDENSSPWNKMCAYGCSKGGIHRWLSNTM